MPPSLTLDKALERTQKRVAAAFDAQSKGGPLWPTQYAKDTPEAAWQFVLSLRTWNEAEQAPQFFPEKEFLEEYVHEWHDCYRTGRTLIMEKCRRMVISWCARALELHQMGLGRCDQLLVGEDLEAAAKHVWRLKHLYSDLRQRQPDWKLPEHSELKYEGERKLKSFGLPNGSVCHYANGQAGGIQGDGYRIITLEEFGIYRYAATMLAQAKIVTQGSAGSVGGFVNIITNASVNQDWQRIKRSEGTSGTGKEGPAERGPLP
jgi:hypothetical protein